MTIFEDARMAHYDENDKSFVQVRAKEAAFVHERCLIRQRAERC